MCSRTGAMHTHTHTHTNTSTYIDKKIDTNTVLLSNSSDFNTLRRTTIREHSACGRAESRECAYTHTHTLTHTHTHTHTHTNKRECARDRDGAREKAREGASERERRAGWWGRGGGE